MDSLWDSLYNSDPHFIKSAENRFQCCGFYNTEDRAVPYNCRVELNFDKGCSQSLVESFKSSMFAVLLVIGCIELVEMFALILTGCIFMTLDKRRNLMYFLDEDNFFVARNPVFRAERQPLINHNNNNNNTGEESNRNYSSLMEM